MEILNFYPLVKLDLQPEATFRDSETKKQALIKKKKFESQCLKIISHTNCKTLLQSFSIHNFIISPHTTIPLYSLSMWRTYVHGIQEPWRYIYCPSHDWSLKEEELGKRSSCAWFCSCLITLPVWMAALLSTAKHVQKKEAYFF